MTRLPTPEQWVIRRMTEPEVAEMIERHIDFVADDGRSVHLPTKFVHHYVRRDDGVLPTIVAVSTLPLVLLTATSSGRTALIDFGALIFASSRKLGPRYRSLAVSTMTMSSEQCAF